MADKRIRRQDTELGMLIVRNMANLMKQEREQRQLGKVEFAKVCGIAAPTYLTFLAGTANPTLFTITRISQALGVPARELLSCGDTSVSVDDLA